MHSTTERVYERIVTIINGEVAHFPACTRIPVPSWRNGRWKIYVEHDEEIYFTNISTAKELDEIVPVLSYSVDYKRWTLVKTY
jgi:hypothetical protein